MKNSLKLIASIALFAVSIGASASSNFKVGVLDMHKIMTDAPQMQKIKADLKSQFKPKEDQLVKARDTLKADADKLRKDSAVLSKADRDDLQKKVMTEQRQLQQQQIAFQQQAMQAQNAAMKTLFDNVRSYAKQVAAKRHLNVVITTEAALYFDDTLDITHQVLDKLKQAKS